MTGVSDDEFAGWGRGLPCRPPAPQRSWTSWTSLPLETGPDPQPGFEDLVECDRRGVDPTPDAARAASNAGVGGHEGLVDCVSHDGLVDALGELRESHDGHARDSVLGLLDDSIENPTLVESRRATLGEVSLPDASSQMAAITDEGHLDDSFHRVGAAFQ